jgi:hypothetical protein
MYSSFPFKEIPRLKKGVPNTDYLLGGLCVWVALVVLCMLNGPQAFGQSSTPASSRSQASRVPLPHLYLRFLTYQNRLDQTVAALQQQGKDGSWLCSYYQKSIGFSDAEFAKVREAAVALESDLKTVDTQAQSAVHAGKTPYASSQSGPRLQAAVHPQPWELRAQRERVIQRDVDALKASLGPKLAAKLDDFLQTQFNPNVAVQPMRPPQIDAPSQR